MNEIIEGNKLIAEFMGFESDKTLIYKVPNLFPFKGYESGFTEFSLTQIGFDKDWNMLMPVVEKISSIPLIGATEKCDVCYPITFGMPDEDGLPMVRFKGSFINRAETLIEATWLAVVEFIKLHNTTK